MSFGFVYGSRGSPQPAILYVHDLLMDSSGQWEAGWKVKSTALASFEDDCYFLTRNLV